MGNNNTFFRYAPYVYLAQPEENGPYYLLAAVRKQENEQVVPLKAADGQIIHYQDDVTSIHLSVSQKENPSDEKEGDFFLECYESRPEHYPSGFDSERLEIEVKVAVMEEGDAAEQKVFTNTIGYVDADTQPLPEEQLDAPLAHNCPYIYLHPGVLLSDVNEDTGNTTGIFYPHVLIAPKGYRLTAKDKILMTSPENGVFESLLIFSAGDDKLNDDRFSPFVNPAELKVNQEHYFDSKQVEGNFTATVICLENEKEAEGLDMLEPKEIHQLLQNLGQGIAYEWPSKAQLPGGKIAPGAALRRAKTRNMSSRRKNALAINISSIV